MQGKHWGSINYTSLRQHYRGDSSVILNFVTPQAFIFFYPAFLLISLEEFEISDLSGLAALRIFCDAEPTSSELNAFRHKRRSLFTLAQLEATQGVFLAVQREINLGTDSWVDEAVGRIEKLIATKLLAGRDIDSPKR